MAAEMAAEIASISSLEKPSEEKDVLPRFWSALFAADSIASVLMSIVLYIPPFLCTRLRQQPVHSV